MSHAKDRFSFLGDIYSKAKTKIKYLMGDCVTNMGNWKCKDYDMRPVWQVQRWEKRPWWFQGNTSDMGSRCFQGESGCTSVRYELRSRSKTLLSPLEAFGQGIDIIRSRFPWFLGGGKEVVLDGWGKFKWCTWILHSHRTRSYWTHPFSGTVLVSSQLLIMDHVTPRSCGLGSRYP